MPELVEETVSIETGFADSNYAKTEDFNDVVYTW